MARKLRKNADDAFRKARRDWLAIKDTPDVETSLRYWRECTRAGLLPEPNTQYFRESPTRYHDGRVNWDQIIQEEYATWCLGKVFETPTITLRPSHLQPGMTYSVWSYGWGDFEANKGKSTYHSSLEDAKQEVKKQIARLCALNKPNPKLRRNADSAFRKLERAISAALADQCNQFPKTLLTRWERAVRKRGLVKNTLAAQGMLIAMAIRETGSGEKVAYLCNWSNSYVPGLPSGKSYNIRRNLSKAIPGGLSRRDTETILMAYGYDIPVATFGPGGEDVNDIVSHWNDDGDTEVIVVYRTSYKGMLQGMQLYQHNERNTPPVTWEGRTIDQSDIKDEVELLEAVANDYQIPVEDIDVSNATTLAQLIFEYCHRNGCETDTEFQGAQGLRNFKRRFCLELAYEDAGWLK